MNAVNNPQRAKDAALDGSHSCNMVSNGRLTCAGAVNVETIMLYLKIVQKVHLHVVADDQHRAYPAQKKSIQSMKRDVAVFK